MIRLEIAEDGSSGTCRVWIVIISIIIPTLTGRSFHCSRPYRILRRAVVGCDSVTYILSCCRITFCICSTMSSSPPDISTLSLHPQQRLHDAYDYDRPQFPFATTQGYNISPLQSALKSKPVRSGLPSVRFPFLCLFYTILTSSYSNGWRATPQRGDLFLPTTTRTFLPLAVLPLLSMSILPLGLLSLRVLFPQIQTMKSFQLPSSSRIYRSM